MIVALKTVHDRIRDLHESLNRRIKPEDIAHEIKMLDRQGAIQLDDEDRKVIARVSTYRTWYSSMSDDFEKPESFDKVVASVEKASGITGGTPDQILQRLCVDLDVDPAQAHVLDPKQRMPKDQRYPMGKRQWNRERRALARLARKQMRVDNQQALRRLVMAKYGLIERITLEQFRADPLAGAFIAYYTAKRKTRRMFSLHGRDNPFDDLCDVLAQQMVVAPNTDWGMVGNVWLPRQSGYGANFLVNHRQELAEIAGAWYEIMDECAVRMGDIFASFNFDLDMMVVKRGMDSSTWNHLAGAYNVARKSWIETLDALDDLHILDLHCPPKAMRVMAADLVYWHRATDGDVDLDTKVWSMLPKPWQVLGGGVMTLTRSQVERVCDSVGADAHKRGWSTPRPIGPVATFEPTPELVHGVSIGSPIWAERLKKAGVFSGAGGRTFNPDVLPDDESWRDQIVSELP
jgi:hypothetical protein